jgi:hypothetical protein
MAHIAHDVYRPLADSDNEMKHIDTVFADYDDPEEMRRSLINHDGYAPDIVVKCKGKTASGSVK